MRHRFTKKMRHHRDLFPDVQDVGGQGADVQSVLVGRQIAPDFEGAFPKGFFGEAIKAPVFSGVQPHFLHPRVLHRE